MKHTPISKNVDFGVSRLGDEGKGWGVAFFVPSYNSFGVFGSRVQSSRDWGERKDFELCETNRHAGKPVGGTPWGPPGLRSETKGSFR